MGEIEKILQSGYKAVLYITGGGTHAIPSLLEGGGGSAFLLEADVPYSQEAFDKILNREGLKLDKDEKYVSPEASAKLAIAAFKRAIKLDSTKDKNIGVGVSAKLSKGPNERKNRNHEVHIAYTLLDNYAKVYSINLNFERNRLTEEVFSSKMIISILESIVGSSHGINLEKLIKKLNLHPEDKLNISEYILPHQ